MIDLKNYCSELKAELVAILQYWMEYSIDTVHGGFYGRVDNNNTSHPAAEKGGVLNARILWSFSAAYNYTKDIAYLQCAQRAYNYFTDHFIDKKYGGIYWSVDYKGNPQDKKKQVYAQSFAIYALSEFYMLPAPPPPCSMQ